MERQNQRTVDVIIPTYHPGEKFDRLLAGLSLQRYPIRRIILVNTEEAGLDPLRLRGYENIEVHHIRREAFNHGASRNLGVSFSMADYFLFMTDDAVPRDEMLVETLVRGMESDARIAAVYGRQLATEESSFDERYSRRFNYPEQSFVKGIEDLPRRGIKTFFQSNVCCLYRREIFDRLGGFEASTIFNEDMLYCAKMLRAGYLSRYEADACVLHAHHYSGIEQLRRNFDLGVSQAEHPEVFGGISSEGEGSRMVFGNARALIREGKPWLLPLLFYRSGCKLLGFWLGRSFRRLPESWVRAMSMNKMYWRQKRR